MENGTQNGRDPFRLSRGGLTAIASYVLAPAIADSWIDANRVSQHQQRGTVTDECCADWPRCDGHAAQTSCA